MQAALAPAKSKGREQEKTGAISVSSASRVTEARALENFLIEAIRFNNAIYSDLYRIQQTVIVHIDHARRSY